jgi:TonB family protein
MRLTPLILAISLLVGCNDSSQDPKYVATANARFSGADQDFSKAGVFYPEQIRRLTLIYRDHPEYMVAFKNTDAAHILPRIRSMAPPKYPFFAKLRNLRAKVEVAFVVDEQGRALDPRVFESQDSRFDDNALDAVAQWSFVPGTIGGEPAKYVLIVPIEFAGVKW